MKHRAGHAEVVAHERREVFAWRGSAVSKPRIYHIETVRHRLHFEAAIKGPFICGLLFLFSDTFSAGAGIAQSVYRLATGRTTEGSEFESR
jgi:hypothetical protein